MNEKKRFEAPSVEITDIYAEDIITASLNQNSSEWPDPKDPWM